MNKVLYINYLFILFCVYSQINCLLTPRKVIYKKKFYIGAVVEYANIFDETKNFKENIQRNIDEYGKFIKRAKEQAADIIVFPEYGLTSTYISEKRNEAILYSSVIPHPEEKINPCEENRIKKYKNYFIPAWSEVLTQISCEAQRNKIYVVINTAERVKFKNDWLLYNTNIVFDRDGTLISRYRKYNLYNEPAFNRTSQPELESFKTDFGVTFGTIICFDILYADPTLTLIRNKGVTDLLYPTAWMSKMPFLTAIQTQAGFVNAYGINLLASNYNNPEKHFGGSGIYSYITGPLNYTIPIIKQSKLIVAKIPKIQNNPKKYLKNYRRQQTKKSYDEKKHLYLETLVERWDGFTTEILESNLTNRVICNEQLCCNFTVISTSEQSDYLYRLVVTDSFRASEIDRHHVQTCGIVACLNESLESCGQRTGLTSYSKLFEEVTIKGNFSSDAKFVLFPSIVNYDLSTLQFSSYSFSAKEIIDSHTIKLKTNKPLNKILGISIYGRSKA